MVYDVLVRSKVLGINTIMLFSFPSSWSGVVWRIPAVLRSRVEKLVELTNFKLGMGVIGFGVVVESQYGGTVAGSGPNPFLTQAGKRRP